MLAFSDARLENLRSQVLAFGTGWKSKAGRELTTLRGGIDFLAAMNGREEFMSPALYKGVSPRRRRSRNVT